MVNTESMDAANDANTTEGVTQLNTAPADVHSSSPVTAPGLCLSFGGQSVSSSEFETSSTPESAGDTSIDISAICCSVPLVKLQDISLESSKKKVPNKKFLCLYCDRTFVTTSLRQKHVDRCHSAKQARRSSSRFQSKTHTVCIYCKKLNSSEHTLRELFRHLALKHPSKYFACLECEERFSFRNLLDEHNLETHNFNSSATQNDRNDLLENDFEDDKFRTKHKARKKEEKEKEIEEKRTLRLRKELRKRKVAVKSTKSGVKRQPPPTKTRKRKKVIENEEKEKNCINPYPTFDAFFRVKKITDHSIDNLKISSLTFDDVFDKAFYNRIKSNIQENLQNHIDGKLFNNEESENRISNFEKMQEVNNTLSENFGCDLTLNAATPVISLLSSQLGEDLESQIEYGAKASKKKVPVKKDEVHYKYFTRRKYQASILENKENRDLSKLDMWTQLIVKDRQQKIINDQKSDKERIEYTKGIEYKTKMQNDELNRILDRRGPFEDLKEEANKMAAIEKMNRLGESASHVSSILDEIFNKVFEKEIKRETETTEKTFDKSDNPSVSEIPVYLNLQKTSLQEEDIDRSDKITLICSSQETENFELTQTPRDKNTLVELTGEWTRTRLYICAACGVKLSNMKLLLDHKSVYHPNVWVQHYEFVGNQSNLYRHLSIPGLGKVGHMEGHSTPKLWKRSDARACTKCSKVCNSLAELHRHMLECGEDWSWMLARKKLKYRPFGSKSRKKRRGLVKRIIHKETADGEPRPKRKYNVKPKHDGPRQRPSDAETIQRMLANLPAKRATRKLISLKDGISKPRRKQVVDPATFENQHNHPQNTKQETTQQKLATKRRKKKKGLKCNPLILRKSVRNINKVLASKVLDNNSTIRVKRKLKSTLQIRTRSRAEEFKVDFEENLTTSSLNKTKMIGESVKRRVLKNSDNKKSKIISETEETVNASTDEIHQNVQENKKKEILNSKIVPSLGLKKTKKKEKIPCNLNAKNVNDKKKPTLNIVKNKSKRIKLKEKRITKIAQVDGSSQISDEILPFLENFHLEERDNDRPNVCISISQPDVTIEETIEAQTFEDISANLGQVISSDLPEENYQGNEKNEESSKSKTEQNQLENQIQKEICNNETQTEILMSDIETKKVNDVIEKDGEIKQTPLSNVTETENIIQDVQMDVTADTIEKELIETHVDNSEQHLIVTKPLIQQKLSESLIKKSKKKSKGLNDCIAMLTSKLQQKSDHFTTENTTNDSESKSEDYSKDTPQESTNCLDLSTNNKKEEVKEDSSISIHAEDKLHNSSHDPLPTDISSLNLTIPKHGFPMSPIKEPILKNIFPPFFNMAPKIHPPFFPLMHNFFPNLLLSNAYFTDQLRKIQEPVKTAPQLVKPVILNVPNLHFNKHFEKPRNDVNHSSEIPINMEEQNKNQIILNTLHAEPCKGMENGEDCVNPYHTLPKNEKNNHIFLSRENTNRNHDLNNVGIEGIKCTSLGSEKVITLCKNEDTKKAEYFDQTPKFEENIFEKINSEPNILSFKNIILSNIGKLENHLKDNELIKKFKEVDVNIEVKSTEKIVDLPLKMEKTKVETKKRQKRNGRKKFSKRRKENINLMLIEGNDQIKDSNEREIDLEIESNIEISKTTLELENSTLNVAEKLENFQSPRTDENQPSVLTDSLEINEASVPTPRESENLESTAIKQPKRRSNSKKKQKVPPEEVTEPKLIHDYEKDFLNIDSAIDDIIKSVDRKINSKKRREKLAEVRDKEEVLNFEEESTLNSTSSKSSRKRQKKTKPTEALDIGLEFQMFLDAHESEVLENKAFLENLSSKKPDQMENNDGDQQNNSTDSEDDIPLSLLIKQKKTSIVNEIVGDNSKHPNKETDEEKKVNTKRRSSLIQKNVNHSEFTEISTDILECAPKESEEVLINDTATKDTRRSRRRSGRSLDKANSSLTRNSTNNKEKIVTEISTNESTIKSPVELPIEVEEISETTTLSKPRRKLEKRTKKSRERQKIENAEHIPEEHPHSERVADDMFKHYNSKQTRSSEIIEKTIENENPKLTNKEDDTSLNVNEQDISLHKEKNSINSDLTVTALNKADITLNLERASPNYELEQSSIKINQNYQEIDFIKEGTVTTKDEITSNNQEVNVNNVEMCLNKNEVKVNGDKIGLCKNNVILDKEKQNPYQDLTLYNDIIQNITELAKEEERVSLGKQKTDLNPKQFTEDVGLNIQETDLIKDSISQIDDELVINGEGEIRGGKKSKCRSKERNTPQEQLIDIAVNTINTNQTLKNTEIYITEDEINRNQNCIDITLNKSDAKPNLNTMELIENGYLFFNEQTLILNEHKTTPKRRGRKRNKTISKISTKAIDVPSEEYTLNVLADRIYNFGNKENTIVESPVMEPDLLQSKPIPNALLNKLHNAQKDEENISKETINKNVIKMSPDNQMDNPILLDGINEEKEIHRPKTDYDQTVIKDQIALEENQGNNGEIITTPLINEVTENKARQNRRKKKKKREKTIDSVCEEPEAILEGTTILEENIDNTIKHDETFQSKEKSEELDHQIEQNHNAETIHVQLVNQIVKKPEKPNIIIKLPKIRKTKEEENVTESLPQIQQKTGKKRKCKTKYGVNIQNFDNIKSEDKLAIPTKDPYEFEETQFNDITSTREVHTIKYSDDNLETNKSKNKEEENFESLTKALEEAIVHTDKIVENPSSADTLTENKEVEKSKLKSPERKKKTIDERKKPKKKDTKKPKGMSIFTDNEDSSEEMGRKARKIKISCQIFQKSNKFISSIDKAKLEEESSDSSQYDRPIIKPNPFQIPIIKEELPDNDGTEGNQENSPENGEGINNNSSIGMIASFQSPMMEIAPTYGEGQGMVNHFGRVPERFEIIPNRFQSIFSKAELQHISKGTIPEPLTEIPSFNGHSEIQKIIKMSTSCEQVMKTAKEILNPFREVPLNFRRISNTCESISIENASKTFTNIFEDIPKIPAEILKTTEIPEIANVPLENPETIEDQPEAHDEVDSPNAYEDHIEKEVESAMEMSMEDLENEIRRRIQMSNMMLQIQATEKVGIEGNPQSNNQIDDEIDKFYSNMRNAVDKIDCDTIEYPVQENQEREENNENFDVEKEFCPSGKVNDDKEGNSEIQQNVISQIQDLSQTELDNTLIQKVTVKKGESKKSRKNSKRKSEKLAMKEYEDEVYNFEESNSPKDCYEDEFIAYSEFQINSESTNGINKLKICRKKICDSVQPLPMEIIYQDKKKSKRSHKKSHSSKKKRNKSEGVKDHFVVHHELIPNSNFGNTVGEGDKILNDVSENKSNLEGDDNAQNHQDLERAETSYKLLEDVEAKELSEDNLISNYNDKENDEKSISNFENELLVEDYDDLHKNMEEDMEIEECPANGSIIENNISIVESSTLIFDHFYPEKPKSPKLAETKTSYTIELLNGDLSNKEYPKIDDLGETSKDNDEIEGDSHKNEIRVEAHINPIEVISESNEINTNSDKNETEIDSKENSIEIDADKSDNVDSVEDQNEMDSTKVSVEIESNKDHIELETNKIEVDFYKNQNEDSFEKVVSDSLSKNENLEDSLVQKELPLEETDKDEKLENSISQNEIFNNFEVPIKTTRFRGKKGKGRKGVRNKREKLPGIENLDEVYCDICNRSFTRMENLVKHKKTLTHIAKLSEIEAREAEIKAKMLEKEKKEEATKSNVGINDILITEQSKSADTSNSDTNNKLEENLPFSLKASNSTINLVDIINDVLDKPIEKENTLIDTYISTSAANLETKRYKSLGERKSFESDINATTYPFNTIPIANDISPKIPTATVLKQQLTILENIIERGYIDDITESSNKSSLSENKSENYFMKPISDNFVKPPTQYEEISNDSLSVKNQFEEQSLRKVLNRDEALFLECCSLLKSSSEVSDFSKKSSKQILQSTFDMKQSDEPEWLESKSLKSQPFQSNGYENSCPNTPLGDGFGDEYSNTNSNTIATDWSTKQREKESGNYQFEDNHDSVHKEERNFSQFVADKRLDDDLSYGSENEECLISDGELELEGDEPAENNVSKFGKFISKTWKKSLQTLKKNNGSKPKKKQLPEITQTSITDYTVPLSAKSEELDNKKVMTKGAMKVFEGLKVSIPTDELDLKELLNGSFATKKDEEKLKEASPEPVPLQEQAKKFAETKRNIIKTFGNSLGLKITKRTHLNKLKDDVPVKEKVEDGKKGHDIYDFEETQDNTDLFGTKLATIKEFRTKEKEKKMSEAIVEKDDELVENNDEIVEKDDEIVENPEKGDESVEKDDEIIEKDDEIIEKDDEVIEKDDEIVEKDDEIIEKDDEFIEKDDDIIEKDDEIVEKDDEIIEKDDEIIEESDSESQGWLDNFGFDAQSVSSYSSESSNLSIKQMGEKNITKKKCMIMGRIFKNAFKANNVKDLPIIDNVKFVEDYVNHLPEQKEENRKLSQEEMDDLFNKLLDDSKELRKEDSCINDIEEPKVGVEKHNAPKAERKSELKKVTNKTAAKRKRQRNNSGSTDDEFSLNKPKRTSKKKSKNIDNSINLEQELRECIGVASRKSQRTCTSGKQNVLVEYWSSDDSNFEAFIRETMSLEAKPTKPKSPECQQPTTDSLPKPSENKKIKLQEMDHVTAIKPTSKATTQPKSKPTDNNNKSKQQGRRKSTNKAVNKTKKIEEDPEDKKLKKVKVTGETLAANRRKRPAADTLYYWSSSSEDESRDFIETKPIRDEMDDDDDDDDIPVQHGWIVGESTKKLVTMLAQAKGKKTETDCVKEQGRKRTTV